MKNWQGLIFLVCFLAIHLTMSYAKKTIVLISRSLPPYEQAWQGFSESGLISGEKKNMEGKREQGQAILTGLTPATTDLVVTIGSEATALAQELVTTIPVVYSMILDQPKLATTKSTGMVVRVHMKKQLSVIHTIFPDKAIGVIYNLHYSGAAVNEARTIAKELGTTLAPIAIEVEGDVPKALKKITHDNIGAFWLLLDPTVAKPKSVQLINQHCLNEKIPFFALSGYHVKAGAFAALAVDYKSIGAETAELAKRVIEDQPVPPVVYPKSLILHVNDTTKSKIGVTTIPALDGVKVINY